MDQRFTLSDAQGVTHEYTVTPHRGSEGQRLFLFLGTLLLEPLAEAAGPVLVNVLTSSSDGGEINTQRLMAALLDDSEALEAAVATLPSAARALRSSLLQLSDATLYELLRFVNRDGKPLVHQGRATDAYDRAFAQNYMELGRALLKVAQINGFLPALGMSGSASAAE